MNHWFDALTTIRTNVQEKWWQEAAKRDPEEFGPRGSGSTVRTAIDLGRAAERATFMRRQGSRSLVRSKAPGRAIPMTQANPAGHPSPFDLEAFIDRQSMGPLQIRVVALCLLTMIIDGYDLFMIGLAVPLIARDFGVAPEDLTPVLVAQSLGLALGTYIAGPFSDRFGRKPMLIVNVAAFAVLTAATTQVGTLGAFAALRFISGVFFGGVIPNAVALSNEMTPRRYRSGVVALVFCGFAAGTTIGSLVNGQLLAGYGWQTIFWIGGGLGFLLVPLLLIALPESARFLARRDPGDPRLMRMLRTMDPGLDLGTAMALPGKREGSSGGLASVRDILSGGRLSLTLLLWATFSFSFVVPTTLAAWSGTLFNQGFGLAIEEAGLLIAVFSFGGLLGSGTSGFVMDRWGPGITLPAYYLAGAVAIFSMGFVDYATALAWVVVAIAGYCATGAQGALNAFASSAYPTSMRATGVGWAFGSGRLASIVGPAIGGQLLAMHLPPSNFFIALAVPLAIIAALSPVLVRTWRRAPMT
ncbi:MFS transporter [Tsuneonella sp. HG222]